jgi:alkanesulfonate monooxygenase SsuD/methylene tetrahydromethanopterin reductase-like flavin-dependent oxidoreductase (luciferase family)
MLIEDWYGLSQTSPLAYLKEYLEIVRDVLWEGRTDYHGTFFKVNNDSPVTMMMANLIRKAQVPLLISAVGLKAFRLAGEISDGAISWVCPIPYLLDQALPALRSGAESHQRPAPPVIAHVQVALSTDEAAVHAVKRPGLQAAMQYGPFARMFAQAGFSGALNGSESELNALIRTLVISGNEATVQERMKELLASGLDELMLQLVPIADEETERKQLLQLVGSL